MQARAYCGQFGFKGGDQQKLVKQLAAKRAGTHYAVYVRSGQTAAERDATLAALPRVTVVSKPRRAAPKPKG